MKKIRKERGITLIALIITIVILLIVAVAAIGAIQDGKIIAHAQNAAGDYNAAKGKEEGRIAEYETLLNKYGGGTGITTTEEGVPVPAGFKVVEGTKDTGLVIEHETEGSQFVWVPVTTAIDENGYKLGTTEYREPDVVTKQSANVGADAIIANLEKAGVTDIQQDGDIDEYDFKALLKREYKAMARSVNNYKGFYVGRYELSVNNGIAQSKADESNIEAVTGAETSADTWYGLYALSRTYNTDNLKSSMISGAQYDAMMEWMGDAANIEISERNMTLNPGTAENDVIKNVYDLYGGVLESTLEAYDYSYRVFRGGSCKQASSASGSGSDGSLPPSTRNFISPVYSGYYLRRFWSTSCFIYKCARKFI